MKSALSFIFYLVACIPGAAFAFTPAFPLPAQPNASEVSDLSSFGLISGAWDGDKLPAVQLEGQVSKQSWRIPTSELTSLQLLSPLRDQLTEQGYDLVFECDTEACGGFDFRFAADVFNEPGMHVNLGDYRFLSARRTAENGGSQALNIMISRTPETGFVQINQLGSAADTPTTTEAVITPVPVTPVVSSDLGQALETRGHAVLEGVTFRSGGTTLAESGMSSLAAVAEYLQQNPSRRVTLVGHTDAVGGLAGNVDLSKRRAQAVMQHLIAELGVRADQITADGVGYLAPRASNLTDAGREANRRVEVTLTSTE